MSKTYSNKNAKFDWFGVEFEYKYRIFIEAQLNRARKKLEKEVKKAISVPNFGGLDPSQPGEPPRAVTELLLDSIFSRMTSKTSFMVGFNREHGLYMEFGIPGGRVITPVHAHMLTWIDPKTGTRKFARKVVQGEIKPRPFLRPTMRKFKKQFLATFKQERFAFGVRR